MTIMAKKTPAAPAKSDKSAAARTPLGVLVIGRKRPGFDQEWNQIMRRKAAVAVAALGFTAVGADLNVVDDQTILAALNTIRDAGCDVLVVLQPSLGNGQLSMTVEQNWDGPLVLFATPERPTGEKVSSCSLVATHLWASVMRQANHPFELVYGDPDDHAVRQQLLGAVAIARTVKKVRGAKVGSVGSHAPGFIAMGADTFTLGRQLGMQLHNLSLTQFIERCKGITDADVRRDVDKVRALEMPMRGVTVDDLPVNSRYYLAIRELMAEEALDAIAIQCWPELSNLVGHWPYLAFTRLTSERVPLAMEGDVDAAVLGLMANHLGLGVGFITDWLEHDATTAGFWHAGVAPLPMCYPIGSPDGPTLGKHFNIEKPMVVDGPLRTDMPVTITRLWRVDGQYHLMAFEGATIPPARHLTGNTCWVHAPGRDVADTFESLCHAGMPHHVTLFEGHHAAALKKLARAMNVRWFDPRHD
jgi:L-fucose isomerase-like protein